MKRKNFIKQGVGCSKEVGGIAYLSVYTKELTTIINNCLKDGLFPNELKLADVSPVFKKDDDLTKENYRLVSILSHMSKVFGRIF